MAKLRVKGGVDQPLRLRSKNIAPRNVTGKQTKAVGSANLRTYSAIKLGNMSIMVSLLLQALSVMALAMRLIVASGSPYPDGRHIAQERLSGPLKRGLERQLLSQSF